MRKKYLSLVLLTTLLLVHGCVESVLCFSVVIQRFTVSPTPWTRYILALRPRFRFNVFFDIRVFAVRRSESELRDIKRKTCTGAGVWNHSTPVDFAGI